MNIAIKLAVAILCAVISTVAHAQKFDQGVNLSWGGQNVNGQGVFASEQKYTDVDGSQKLIVFLAWFTYNPNGTPTWRVITCSPFNKDSQGRGTCTTDLLKATGSKPMNYNPNAFAAAISGTVSITYTSATTATFNYNFEGQVGTINLVPQVFGPTNANLQYGKLWWGGLPFNGEGVFLSQQGNIIFGAWFGYNPDSTPMWWVFTCNPMSKDVLGRDTCTTDLLKATSSGPVGYNPNLFTPALAGQVTITFNSDREMTMNYNFEGQVGTLNLVPQIFGADRQHPPKLLALIQGDSNNGYVDINLDTFTGVQKNPGGSFYGADYDEVSGNIVLSSALPGSTQTYTFVNFNSGAVSAGLNLSAQSAPRTPVKCEVKSSPRAGLCYYGFGLNNDGRVVVANGRNVVETVTLPDAVSSNRVPRQFALVGSTLVVSTISNFGVLDVVHRLDVSKTPRVWLAPITLPVKVTGIAVKGNNLYVSGLTSTGIFKMLIVETISGNVQDSNLSFDYAGGIALSEDTLFFSALGKVRAYKLSDLSLLGEITLPGNEKIVYYGGYLYVSNTNGTLYKVDAVTRTKVAELAVPRMGTGELVVVAP